MKITIYHNQECSKSCSALDQLKQTEHEISIINYLLTPPSKTELLELIDMLHIRPVELIRQNEPEFQPYLEKQLTDEESIALMLRHPVLIQRPIVVKGENAFIVRPPLTINDIL